MRIYYLSTLFLLIHFSAFNQDFSQGVVYSSENIEVIKGAHIFNVSNDNVDFTSEEGSFKIEASIGDTLRITFVGFKPQLKIIDTTDFLSVMLVPEIMQLEEVKVYNLPQDHYDFKREVIDMGVVEIDSFIPYGVNPGKPKGKIPKLYERGTDIKFGANENFWPTFTLPLSYLTKKFSKIHKAKRDYFELKASEDQRIRNDKKFSKEIVTKLTGLKGEELMAFMSFMNLSSDFITKSTDYEIAKRVIDSYEEYSSKFITK